MRLMPENPEYGRLTVRCKASNYSASIIARAVEDANAHLINLNVTADSNGPDMVVDLRVSHRNTASVARSLARHGFDVTSADGDEQDGASRPNPYAALIRYLDI